MSERGHYNQEFVSEIREWMRRGPNYDNAQAVELVNKYGEQFLGQGLEAVVVTKGGPESKLAVAFSYRDIKPEQAKKTFYLQRIFSRLFPHNFPRFYVSGSGNKEQSFTIRQRIKGGDPALVTHSFKDVLQTCNKLGIKFLWDYFKEENFLTTDQGDEYYVDSLHTANFSEWDMDRIIDYMRQNGCSDEDIRTVQSSYQRLSLLPDTYYDDDRAREEFLKNIP